MSQIPNVPERPMSWPTDGTDATTEKTADPPYPDAESAELVHARQRLLQENLILMWGVVRREQEALERLHDQFGGSVLGVCTRILHDQAEAEEVAADVFWELWERPYRYNPRRGSLLTYLMLLTRSRAIDRLRSRGRLHANIVHRDLNDGADEASGDTSNESSPPMESMALQELRRDVHAELKKLPEEQREAIELCFFHGLSHQQAADALNVPLGTIKTRIRQGLIRLREALPRMKEGVIR